MNLRAFQVPVWLRKTVSTSLARLRFEDGEQWGQQGELDAGDGFEAQEPVFDLGRELDVGGFVGGGGVERDAGDVPRWNAGNVLARGG
jgi:hypothetical protein